MNEINSAESSLKNISCHLSRLSFVHNYAPRTSQCICPALTRQITPSQGRIIAPVINDRAIFGTYDAVTNFGT